MSYSKTSYRKQAMNLLKNMSLDDKQSTEKKLRHYLLRTDEWQQAQTVGITISQGSEWDTHTLIQLAWEAGKRVAVPKCQPSDKTMTFYYLDNFAQLEVVYYNLLEPKPDPNLTISKNQIDLLIVPGVMFDKKGYRVGFGGGYYDRFLANYTQTTVSLLSSKQLTDKLPTDPFDKPVDLLVTEQGPIKKGGA